MKRYRLLLVAVVLLTGIISSALAQTITPFRMVTNRGLSFVEITPYYTHTASITAALSFSSGKANCSGVLKPSTSDDCWVTVTLYKQNGSGWSYVTSWTGSAKNGGTASASGSYSVGSGTYKVTTDGNVGNKEYPTKSVTRSNSSLTLGDTLAYAKDTLEKLGDAPDAWQYDRPRDLFIYAGIDENTGQPLYDDIYIYVIRQQLYGVPLLAHVVHGIENPRDQEPGLRGGSIMVQTSTLDSRLISGSKVKIIDVDAEDVPLCDFSLVQASLENEINDGHIRKIFDLELGYVLYTTPNPEKPLSGETLVFYAVPTWQVQCFYMANGKKEMSDHSNPNVTPIAIAQIEYKTVFVNAQTGKVIDRLDNRLGCGNYQGFISWEDVGGKR